MTPYEQINLTNQPTNQPTTCNNLKRKANRANGVFIFFKIKFCWLGYENIGRLGCSRALCQLDPFSRLLNQS